MLEYTIERDGQGSYIIRPAEAQDEMFGLVWKRRTKAGLWHAARHEWTGYGNNYHWVEVRTVFDRRKDAITELVGTKRTPA